MWKTTTTTTTTSESFCLTERERKEERTETDVEGRMDGAFGDQMNGAHRESEKEEAGAADIVVSAVL